MTHGGAQVHVAKQLLCGNGVAGQLGEDGACTTPESIQTLAFPSLFTNCWPLDRHYIISDVEMHSPILVWKHPTFAWLSALLMPSFE